MINSKKMKISIVIPARNEARLIADCLRSLKNQTYQGDCEILVVDNASTDNTAEIAQSFGVRVIRADKEKNVFYARQVGAEAADGDIIVQADADTIYPEHWLKRIADKMASHPEAAAIAGRFLYREKFIWSFVELTVRNILNIVATAFWGRPLLVSGATFAFRRQAFNEVGGYKGLSYSADQHGITGRLRKLGEILYDPKVYVLTSSRSVRKPCFILLMAVTANLVNLLLDFGKNLLIPRPKARQRSLKNRLALGFSLIMVFFIAFSAYGYFSPTSPVFGRVYYKGDSGEKVVALTFDDGPNEPYTSQILDILKEYDIKATFFVIGKNVEEYPDIAKRIIAEGSVLGNHSNTHDANHALSTYGERDLVDAENIIYSVTGVKPHLYRPPHGKKTPWELDCVKENKLIEVTWNTTTNDQPTTDVIDQKAVETYAAKIVKATRLGSIILLHDGYGTSHDNKDADKSLTVKALPLIIEQLQAKGYRFVTVPELLDVPAYNEVR
jgi:peptidoglycan/xylan/chitin deacetylase (PgdA/CDA1 family)